MFPINWLELIETYETRLDHDCGDRRSDSRCGLSRNEATKQTLKHRLGSLGLETLDSPLRDVGTRASRNEQPVGRHPKVTLFFHD